MGGDLKVGPTAGRKPAGGSILSSSTSGPLEIDLPGRIWPDFKMESQKIGSPAGPRPAEGPILKLSGLEFGRHSADWCETDGRNQ